MPLSLGDGDLSQGCWGAALGPWDWERRHAVVVVGTMGFSIGNASRLVFQRDFDSGSRFQPHSGLPDRSYEPVDRLSTGCERRHIELSPSPNPGCCGHQLAASGDLTLQY